ncbi:MAG: ABC transporter permease [Paludibacteraceae bacterium]|nr:ABC transporter permease [Paludibacteraceae bacterium]
MGFFHILGEYVLLQVKVFRAPDKGRMFWRQFAEELDKLGTQSIPIDLIISLFIGAIMTMQVKLDTSNPLIPRYSTGLTMRDTLLLEFSSTILCLILAGKVGSNIASEIGTMRITEQIDAMDIMGINSANYLILPKITAFVLMMPMLVVFSIASGLVGGYLIARYGGIMTVDDYMYGITYAFIPIHVPYAITKSMIFGFVITSISGYYGYCVRGGGALDVGKASTNAVVKSIVVILFLDIFITKLVLG